MNSDINYKNNPLHGVSLKKMLTEMVEHYGFTILFAYLNINCFKTNPSIESSVKFLKNSDWARENVEAFYLYQFKSLPRASAEQFELSPRDRIIPEHQTPGEPAKLSLEDAERLREKRAIKAAAHRSGKRPDPTRGRDGANRRTTTGTDTRNSPAPAFNPDADPWAKWRK